jgi:hypothetical protein
MEKQKNSVIWEMFVVLIDHLEILCLLVSGIGLLNIVIIKLLGLNVNFGFFNPGF